MKAWVGRLLAAGQCVLAGSLAWQWLCAAPTASTSTSGGRLRVGARRVRQRFDVSGGRVAPQIVSTEDGVSPSRRLPRSAELRPPGRPPRPGHLRGRDRGAGRSAGSRSSRALSEAADIAQPLPATSGVLELANEGPLLVVGSEGGAGSRVGPTLLGLLALLALTGLRAGRLRPLAFPAGDLGSHRPAGRSHRRHLGRALPRRCWRSACGLPAIACRPGSRTRGGAWARSTRIPAGRTRRATAPASLRASTPSASGSTATSCAWASSPGPRSSSGLPLPLRHRCRGLPQLRTGATPPWWRPSETPSPTA